MGEWHIILFSAVCFLTALLHHCLTSQQHTVTWYKTWTQNHHMLTFFEIKPLMALAISSASDCSLFSLPPKTHLSSSCTKVKTKRLGGWNHSCTVNMCSCDDSDHVKPPCWSFRHSQSSTWLNMNHDSPSVLNISWALLLRLCHKVVNLYWFTFISRGCPLPLMTVKLQLFSVCRWHFNIRLLKCTSDGFNIYLGTKLTIHAATLWGSPPGTARPSSTEKWQDNLIRMEGKGSELISYNGKKKEMDSGREESG